MDLTNREQLYKIVKSRDRRFDGRFYCGVKTTGIYCRPICPARPKFENLLFFRSAAEAEIEGYRACLRCRPDLAPHSVQWQGTAAVVGRALHLISNGEADEISLEEFALRLGVSDRHLRRLFDQHLGASPMDVTSSKRLHLARHLLSQSSLSVTNVAFASGFRSVRRFNGAFKSRFKTAPSKLRHDRGGAPYIQVELPVIGPYDWEHIYGFLKNHSMVGIEAFEDQTYRRAFRLQNKDGAVQLMFQPNNQQLSAQIFLQDPVQLRPVLEKVRHVFDTRLNPFCHLADLSKGDAISHLYRRQLGVRIPGAWDGFETAICIILGQLISTEQARLKVARLIERFGEKISNPIFSDCGKTFPVPELLAKESLREIGLTRIREGAIKEISRQVAEKELDLSPFASLEKTKQQLLSIKGIGPWTVEMIAMRCLGDCNAFPRKDLIVRRALEKHKALKGDWSPWNAYIALSIWKNHTSKKSIRRSVASASSPTKKP